MMIPKFRNRYLLFFSETACFYSRVVDELHFVKKHQRLSPVEADLMPDRMTDDAPRASLDYDADDFKYVAECAGDAL